MRARNNSRHSQRGVAMFIALFALLLLTAVGMALMFTGDTETSINSNFRSSQLAYYAAKSGLEEGRERLRFGNTYSIPWAGAPANLLRALPSAATPTGVVYILNPSAGENITPWTLGSRYFDDELCHENYPGLGLPATPLTMPCTVAVGGNYYTVAPVGANSSLDPYYNTAGSIPYKWVRITLKMVGSTSPFCVDGAASCATAIQDPNFNKTVCVTSNAAGAYYEVVNPGAVGTTCEQNSQTLKSVYMITALAITNTGARRMVQYEAAPVALPPFPAALTIDGNGPVLYPPTSNAFTLSGNDKIGAGGDGTAACAGATPGPNMPGIGTVSDTAKNDIINDINNPPAGAPRPGNYTGSSGTTPDVQNVTTTPNPISPSLTSCPGVQALYNQMLTMADQVVPSCYGCGTSPAASLGTQTSPQTTVINGDFTLDTNNANGAGILVVTGNLTFKGNPPFYGLILVIGQGSVVASSGGGNGNLYGSIFLANCFNAAHTWTGSTCDAAGGNPGTGTNPCLPGTSTFDWSKGGGTYNVQYDSCWVNNLGNRSAFKVLASREQLY